MRWYDHGKRLPKRDRFSIGQRVEQHLLEVLTLTVRAYRTSTPTRKRAFLDDASQHLELAKILIRLAHDVRAIEERHYLAYQAELQEIGRMLGGWFRSLD